MEYIELEIWLRSRELVNLVYMLTKKFPKSETLALVSQINRAVIPNYQLTTNNY